MFILTCEYLWFDILVFTAFQNMIRTVKISPHWDLGGTWPGCAGISEGLGQAVLGPLKD